MPSNRKLFTCFVGMLSFLGVITLVGWLLTQPSDLFLGLGVLLVFFAFAFVFGRSYFNFLRRVFCEKDSAGA